MKGFLAGVAATLLVVAVFPSVGRTVMAAPYALAAWTGTSWYGGDMPAGGEFGRGRGAMPRGGGRVAPAALAP